jgi:hypothetical protein
MLPTVAYQYWVYKVDTAFQARAKWPTPSPPFIWDVLGYGLIFFLPAVMLALDLAQRRRRVAEVFTDRQALSLVICWAVAAFAVSYAPIFAFQRKLLMGEDIPLCLLAGAASVYLVRRFAPRARAVLLTVLVLATIPTCALFVYRDCTYVMANRSATNLAPFLGGDEIDTLGWIRSHTQPDDGILGFPNLMVFVPGYCDRAVYAAHWDETPDLPGKEALIARFIQPGTTDPDRVSFLRETRVRYLVYPTDVSSINKTASQTNTMRFADFAGAPPAYLVPVHRNSLYTIFAIRLP